MNFLLLAATIYGAAFLSQVTFDFTNGVLQKRLYNPFNSNPFLRTVIWTVATAVIFGTALTLMGFATGYRLKKA